MMPSIFGENLFDDFFGRDFDLFPALPGGNPLYGKHAKNLMKTDVRETEDTYELDIDLPGFKKDEIFRIETMSCTLPEVMVYLTNTQDQYESVYGEEIWKTHLDGVTLEESIKETVLAQLAQIKTMNLLAQQHGVSLEDGEREKAREAAGIYFGSLNETEREAMQVNEEIIEQLYGELALANKVYEFIIKDINPEISDDEARSITIQDILIKTYSQDGAGKRIAYEETAREDAYERAREILLLAREEFPHNHMLYHRRNAPFAE